MSKGVPKASLENLEERRWFKWGPPACTQDVSHRLSQDFNFPSYQTGLMISFFLLKERNEMSRKLCGPRDKACCPGRIAKERSEACAENWQFYRETGTNIRLQKKAL